MNFLLTSSRANRLVSLKQIFYCVCLWGLSTSLYAQVPSNPNKVDKKNLRQGKWTITFDKNWNPTTIKDSISYYRIITYKDDKPYGLVTDYYISGKKQYEAHLLEDRPTEVAQGKAVWYNEAGIVTREGYFEKGFQEGAGTYYYESGKKYTEGQFKKGNAEGRFPYYDEEGNIFKVEYYENGEQPPRQKIWDAAVELYNKEDYASAEVMFKDLHLLFATDNGVDHPDNAYALWFLWLSQYHLKKADEAIKNANEMCRVRELQKIPKDSTYRDWLYEMVSGFKGLDRLDEMEAPIIKAIAIEKEIAGDYSERLFTYRRTLGDYYRLMKRFDEGEKVFLSNITDLKKLFPNRPELYNYDMGALAFLYEKNQEYFKAEKLYRDAADSFRQKKDTVHTYAKVLSLLCDILQSQNKNQEAVPVAKELVELQKNRKGKNSREHATALKELYKSYRELKQFSLAETTLKDFLEATQFIYGIDSFEARSIDFDKALLYDEMNDKTSGILYYDRAVAWYKQHYAPYTDDEARAAVAEVLTYAGSFLASNEEYIRAELYLSEAAKLVEAITTKEGLRIASIYHNMGMAHIRIKNYTEAEQAFIIASNITQKEYGLRNYNYYTSLLNIALVYAYSKQFDKALLLLNDVGSKVLEDYGKESEAYISLLRNKANYYRETKQLKEQIDIRKEIADHARRTHGESSQQYYNELLMLVQTMVDEDFKDEAKVLLDELESLMKKRNLKPIDHDYQLFATVKYGWQMVAKDYEGAMETARMKVEIGKQTGSRSYGLIDYSYAALYQNKMNEALKANEQYIDIIIENVHKTFPYLSEGQKVAFYNAEVNYHLDLYYWMALFEPLNINTGRDSAASASNKAAREKIIYVRHPNNQKILNYQIQSKGILFEASQKVKKAILGSKDELLINLYNQWQARKEEMNKVFLEPDSKEKEVRKNEISKQIKLLEKDLALKSSYFTQSTGTAYTWRDAQKKLKKGEALVEILAVSAGQKLNGKKYSDMYLALVVTPETKTHPLLVRLGEGDSLEGKYARLYQNTIKFKLEEKLLYNKYWKRLADTLKTTKRIYFSPDGIYHKVNVNTLRNPLTGKYVLEEKEVLFISQTRDFITRKETFSKVPDNLVLFGSPNYNNLPPGLEKDQNEERGLASVEKKLRLEVIVRDSSQRFFNGDAITELPGTEKEITNIAGIAQANKLSIQKYLYDDATEKKLKSVESPSILHVATHGFFMNENVAATVDGRNGFANFTTDDLKNPLRRSGLLFSYCKQAFSREKNKPQLEEDGILTADEAQNLSLDNTDLVVLSACETGLGEVKNGEGVYGLQRAFQTAGAKSVLMSLWTVSDNATQELMTEFYNQWFILKDKRAAFRQAQMNLKQKFPEPFYWGAFVLVGD